MAMLSVGLTASLVDRWMERRSECPPLVVQHVIHQAAVGAVEAKRLDGVGEAQAAAALRALTDINSQPEEVRLCVLLAEREAR